LECALERVQDAEEGAIALLNENAEIFRQARLALANITLLRQQLNKARKGAPVGFAFGGVSFGIGVPLTIQGIKTYDSTMLWTGVGFTIGTGLVWATGHYLLRWW